MAPSWLRFIVNWIARRRLPKGVLQTHQRVGPRRRASFPTYEPIRHQQQRPQHQQFPSQPQMQQYNHNHHPVPPPPRHSYEYEGQQQTPYYATTGRGRTRTMSAAAVTGKPSSAPLGPQIQPLTPYAQHNTNNNAQPNNTNNPYTRHARTLSSSSYKATATSVPSPFTAQQLDAYRAMGLVPVAHMVPGSNQPQYYLVPAHLQSMAQVPSAQPVTMGNHGNATGKNGVGQGQPVTPIPTTAASRPRPRSLPRPAPPPPPPTPKTPGTHSNLLATPGGPPRNPPPSPVTPRPAPPPPPTTRKTRISRRNSAPISSVPYNASPKRVHDAYARYTSFWTPSSPSRSPLSKSKKPLTFKSVAWPMVDPPFLPTSITVHAVRAFLLSPHHSSGIPARVRVEQAQAMWEPAAFWSRFGGNGVKGGEGEKEMIDRALAFLQGTLRILAQEVVAAEDGLDVQAE